MKRLFKVIYFAGIILQVILRFPYARQSRPIPKTDQRVTPSERILLTGLTLGGLLFPVIFSLTSWLDFANYRWSAAKKARAGSIGAALLGASLWLFWRSHYDLGKNWSPSLEINEQQMLITQGVYSKIRHPMYTSQLLQSLAQALLLQNWIAGLGGLATFLGFYFIRMPEEERMMADHFGDEYRDYSVRTGRIVPRVRRPI